MSQITCKKISIVIIHYNTPHYLKTCFEGILKQTYKNIEVIFIDNNSPDKDGLKYVQKEYTENPKIKVVPNDDNLGYAKAANQGISMAIEGEDKADYVVITNPDIIYSPTYFEKVLHRIEKDPKIAAITGKVYKYDFDRNQPTNIIDTVGLFAYKSRRIIDDGQGLIDDGQFNQECEVFGVSGACPMYRREALEDVKVMGEYLDEDFFMYKEDVDISWRFLLYGWKSIFFPKAIAFHGRGTGIYRRFFNRDVLKNRSKLSKFQKHYSFKNQNLMQVKNELPLAFLLNFPRIVFRKLATFAYITVREPYLWKSYLAYLKQAPRILKKRRLIMENRRVSNKEMGKWFRRQSKYLKKSKD
jgi:GT2 family glycosyltransferase